MTLIDEAIKNLELTSQKLEAYASDPMRYNTEFAYYLDMMSFEMRKQASELRETRYLLGDLI